MAADVANTMARSFIDYMGTLRRSETEHIRGQLKIELKQSRQELDKVRQASIESALAWLMTASVKPAASLAHDIIQITRQTLGRTCGLAANRVAWGRIFLRRASVRPKITPIGPGNPKDVCQSEGIKEGVAGCPQSWT
jgi:hypothetical protein